MKAEWMCLIDLNQVSFQNRMPSQVIKKHKINLKRGENYQMQVYCVTIKHFFRSYKWNNFTDHRIRIFLVVARDKFSVY